MVTKTDLIEWIERSRQRKAIIRVLRKPMTSSEISQAGHRHGVSLHHKDIKGIMRVFLDLKVVQVLSQDLTTGKLYCLTELGREIAHKRFDLECRPLHPGLDWRTYSRIVRSKMKRMVLIGLGDGLHRGNRTVPGLTAVLVKKQLLGVYPLSLNNSRDCLRSLLQMGLIEVAGYTDKRTLKLYQPTRMGWLIYDQLKA